MSGNIVYEMRKGVFVCLRVCMCVSVCVRACKSARTEKINRGENRQPGFFQILENTHRKTRVGG